MPGIALGLAKTAFWVLYFIGSGSSRQSAQNSSSDKAPWGKACVYVPPTLGAASKQAVGSLSEAVPAEN